MVSVAWVLLKVQQKPAPQFIGFEPRRNYFSAHFHTNDESKERFFFKAITGSSVECLAWDGQTFSKPTKVDVSTIDADTVDVFHWYRKIHVRTVGTQAFFKSEVTLQPFFRNLKEFLAQRVYNSHFKLRQERQEVLRELLDRSILFSQQTNRIDPFSAKKSAVEWFFEIHGDRAGQHPTYDENVLKFRALLHSLVASSDLKEEDHRISVSPQSLVSLANFELEERRHQDQLSTNRRIALLTAVLVIIAAADAVIQFVTSWWQA
jgi:hypothetical protein